MEHERVGRVVHEGAEAGLALPQCFFGALALRDVSPDPAVACEAPRLVKDGSPETDT